MSSEKNSWILHDVIQGLNLLTVVGMLITGLLFITDMRQVSAVQAVQLLEHERRIGTIVETHRTTEHEVLEAIKDLRREYLEVHLRLLDRLDRLFEKRTRWRALEDTNPP